VPKNSRARFNVSGEIANDDCDDETEDDGDSDVFPVIDDDNGDDGDSKVDDEVVDAFVAIAQLCCCCCCCRIFLILITLHFPFLTTSGSISTLRKFFFTSLHSSITRCRPWSLYRLS
jgi:hypothetical protein